MLFRIWLPTLVCALLVVSFTGFADTKKPTERSVELTVLLRLNALEISSLMKQYESLCKLEQEQMNALRSAKTDRQRHAAMVAHEETRNDLEHLKEKLVELETSKLKMERRLGDKKPDQPSLPDTADKVTRKLDEILLRLTRIEKRLDKLEGTKK
jgi:chromosome segregation ATPase